MKNRSGRFVVAKRDNHNARVRDIYGVDDKPLEANAVWNTISYHEFRYLNGAIHIANISGGIVIDLGKNTVVYRS